MVQRSRRFKPLGGKKTRCRILDLVGCGKDQGYDGPGQYVVPLLWSGSAWQIAPIPTSNAYRKERRPRRHRDPQRRPRASTKVVDAALVAFAAKKPVEATGFLDPILPELTRMRILRRVLRRGVPARRVDAPTGVTRPAAGQGCGSNCRKGLKGQGAANRNHPCRVRIYPLTPEFANRRSGNRLRR